LARLPFREVVHQAEHVALFRPGRYFRLGQLLTKNLIEVIKSIFGVIVDVLSTKSWTAFLVEI
jgi:hypothetical protein